MYRDTITHEEIADARGFSPWHAAQRLMRDRTQALMKKSGAANVVSGVLTTFEDPRAMTQELRVSFNSSAWTGR